MLGSNPDADVLGKNPDVSDIAPEADVIEPIPDGAALVADRFDSASASAADGDNVGGDCMLDMNEGMMLSTEERDPLLACEEMCVAIHRRQCVAGIHRQGAGRCSLGIFGERLPATCGAAPSSSMLLGPLFGNIGDQSLSQ